jgi:hypothetical protein
MTKVSLPVELLLEELIQDRDAQTYHIVDRRHSLVTCGSRCATPHPPGPGGSSANRTRHLSPDGTTLALVRGGQIALMPAAGGWPCDADEYGGRRIRACVVSRRQEDRVCEPWKHLGGSHLWRRANAADLRSAGATRWKRATSGSCRLRADQRTRLISSVSQA